MVKAASLLYAIFTSLIIAIFCASLLLIFTFNNELDTYFLGRTQLIQNNRAIISHILHDQSYNLIKEGSQEIVSKKGIVTKIEVHSWGVFDVYSIISSLKKDTIKQHLLMARGQTKNKPALYLRNNDTPLKISGETFISGDVYISQLGIEKTKITGGSIKNSPKHLGEIQASKKQLPKLTIPTFTFPEKYNLETLDAIDEQIFTNTFDSKTIIFEVTNTLNNVHLKGNIIIQSKDTLVIGKSAFLEDVIVVAPKVIYESGFKGNTQTYASSDVIVENNVHLNYPSIITVSRDNEATSFIHIQDNTRVEGAIILEGNGLITENKKRIQIDENALIKGDVFCDGVLSLYGVVEGSVIASSLLHKTGTATYTNLIYGGKIYSEKLVNHFFELPLVNYYKEQEMIAIKQL